MRGIDYGESKRRSRLVSFGWSENSDEIPSRGGRCGFLKPLVGRRHWNERISMMEVSTECPLDPQLQTLAEDAEDAEE